MSLSEPVPLRNLASTAKALGISERTLHRLVTEGEVPYHRVGGQIRFNLDEVLASTRVEASTS